MKTCSTRLISRIRTTKNLRLRGRTVGSGLKYRNKLNNLAYAISNFATDNSSPFKLKNGPAVIGVSEIENEQVLEDLIHTGELSKRNYGIVHYDSPDFRGIDVGLIYDKDQFTLESSRSARLHTPQFPDLRTRDQLVVSGILAGEQVHFIVNHWPSRLGGEKQSSQNGKPLPH